MRIYLDTNTIIYAIEGKDQSLSTLAERLLRRADARFVTSRLTRIEAMGPAAHRLTPWSNRSTDGFSRILG